MPFRDNYADFIFSRSTIPFVADKVKARRETYRILKPVVIAYIVHGEVGTMIDPKTLERLVRQHLSWDIPDGNRPGGRDGPRKGLSDLERKAAIPDENYRLIIEPQIGWWLEIIK